MSLNKNNKKSNLSFSIIGWLIVFFVLILNISISLIILKNVNKDRFENKNESLPINFNISKTEITHLSTKKDITKPPNLSPKIFNRTTPTPSPTNILPPTSAPTYPNENSKESISNNWKTYIDKDFKFKTKYYPLLSVTEIYDDQDLKFNNPIKIIRFATGEQGYNFLKSPYGFEITVINQFSEEVFLAKTVGHITDKIDSVEKVVFNNILWKKFNYQVFITTDYVKETTAVAIFNNFAIMIRSLTPNIDNILSNFFFEY